MDQFSTFSEWADFVRRLPPDDTVLHVDIDGTLVDYGSFIGSSRWSAAWAFAADLRAKYRRHVAVTALSLGLVETTDFVYPEIVVAARSERRRFPGGLPVSLDEGLERFRDKCVEPSASMRDLIFAMFSLETVADVKSEVRLVRKNMTLQPVDPNAEDVLLALEDEGYEVVYNTSRTSAESAVRDLHLAGYSERPIYTRTSAALNKGLHVVSSTRKNAVLLDDSPSFLSPFVLTTVRMDRNGFGCHFVGKVRGAVYPGEVAFKPTVI